MVVHAFPLAKLGALLMKQISKPIANLVKSRAKTHPVFRRYVCLPPAQFYNWCEVKAKMWLLKFGQPVNISVLNEEASIELGANLVGESVIFLIAAGILVSEYNRSSKKEAAKEAKKEAEMIALQDAIRDLFIQTEEQAAHIRELTRKIGDLDGRVVQKPWVPKNNAPIDDPPPRKPPTFVPYDSLDIEAVENETSNNNGNNNEELKDNQIRAEVSGNISDSWFLNGLNVVDDVFLKAPSQRQRHPGILNTALTLLYEDVYRTPLKFY